MKAITDNVAAHTGTASATISDAQYDDLHRLKSVQRPGVAVVNYTYNEVGNVTMNGEAGTGQYIYGPASGVKPRSQAVKEENGRYYTYDLVGNMTLRGNQWLEYDSRNRLTSVNSPGATVMFGYAATGERLWKQTTAGLHVWIGSLYEVRNGVPRFHILADGKRVATIEPSTATIHYNHPDHLGSASILTSGAGSETRHWEYTPYGRERHPDVAQPFAVAHRFTGQVLDEETGLYYYRSRYYDPNVARFIQADPIIPDLTNPQAFNRYAYTLNNPLRYTDPSGHGPREIVKNLADFYGNAVIGVGNVVNPIPVEMRPAPPPPTSSLGSFGRKYGETLGLVIAAGETAFGATMTLGGSAATVPSGGAALPVAVAGVGLTTLGLAGIHNYMNMNKATGPGTGTGPAQARPGQSGRRAPDADIIEGDTTQTGRRKVRLACLMIGMFIIGFLRCTRIILSSKSSTFTAQVIPAE